MPHSIDPSGPRQILCIRYSTVAGYFLQDEPNTGPSTVNYTTVSFGLIKRSYDGDINDESYLPWQRFILHLSHINQAARVFEEGVQYKLLFLGRHGEGVHNFAENLYGTLAWNNFWARQRGDGNLSWSDTELTTLGEQQARTARNVWAHLMESQGLDLPEKYYTSPLERCLATAKLTFSDLPQPRGEPFSPQVKELLRETIGVRTCDRRKPMYSILKKYPTYTMEPCFSERDDLWEADHRESDGCHDIRTKFLLDDIFTNDSSTIISFTTHSGTIASILRVIGHREFRLQSGGVMPVLVRAETFYKET